MKIAKNRTMASLIALFLMLTIAASIVALPTANAQLPVINMETHTYVAPPPVTGVGETTWIVYFLDRMPMPADDDPLDVARIREGYDGIQLIITKPDGTSETFTMGRTDPVGAGVYTYTPTEIGVYSVKAVFPGNWKNRTAPIPYGSTSFRSLPAGAYYHAPSESFPANFTVQTDPVSKWPNPPLPTGYWVRPITGAANTWYVLAANWLGGAANVWPQGGSGGTTTNYGYGTAPESAHILWTRQYYPSGDIEDERFGALGNRYGGYQAVGYSADPILDGKIHVTPQKTVHDSGGGWEIWDLYTGEQLFYDPEATRPTVGQIYWYDTGNEHGLNLYLWRSSGIVLPEIVRLAQVQYMGPGKWPRRIAENIVVNTTKTPIVTGTLRELLDAYTGKTICYIANVSTTGTQVYAKNGDILYYNARNLGTSSNPNYYLQIWNSSAGTMVASENGTGAWQWRPSGGSGAGAYVSYFGSVGSDIVHDGNLMWSLNVSMPSILGPRNPVQNQTATIRAVREGEYIIFGTTGRTNEDGIAPTWLLCLSLERGKEGQKLWETSITPPFSSQGWYQQVNTVGVFPEQEVVVFNSETELINPIVYDMKTAEKLWQGDPTTERQLSYYGYQTLFYDDMIITGGTHSGVNTAYEARTGEVRWQYTAVGEGTDSPYGNDLSRGFYVADGKLFTSVSEHSPSSPLWRTPGLKCLNITTGEVLWKILFWASGIKFADGILTAWNLYDGQTYAFGKGPSATTVMASPDVSVHGSSVMIKGTMTDQTPMGRRNVNNLLEFSLKGTPAISDEDMQAWMEYKFMGQAYPADAEGVEVVLSVMDPNGNMYEIGRTTSDIEGNYGYAFEPLVPGTYQVIATFEGTASYYPSSATTYLTVDEAPAATAEPTPVPASAADLYFMPVSIGIIVAIIAVGIVLILMLRKR
ncbi:PQQ-binding-like beta-propeller repeat protein [Candidatus Bathyarchaeota archaeon]|nr:PQQ-binding-like beta-propeller repeat protein [Candidatus Bathyarchaeota archaeon]